MGKRNVSSNGTSAAEATSVQEVQMNQPTATETTSTEQPAVRLCECGCNEPVVGKKAKFVIGHDGRHKGNLLRRYDQGDEVAGAELVERGWRSQADLDARHDLPRRRAAISVEIRLERLMNKLDRARADVARLEAEVAMLKGSAG